jgi:hypothetical protein
LAPWQARQPATSSTRRAQARERVAAAPRGGEHDRDGRGTEHVAAGQARQRLGRARAQEHEREGVEVLSSEVDDVLAQALAQQDVGALDEDRFAVDEVARDAQSAPHIRVGVAFAVRDCHAPEGAVADGGSEGAGRLRLGQQPDLDDVRSAQRAEDMEKDGFRRYRHERLWTRAKAGLGRLPRAGSGHDEGARDLHPDQRPKHARLPRRRREMPIPFPTARSCRRMPFIRHEPNDPHV